MPKSPNCTAVWPLESPARRPRWYFRNLVLFGSSISDHLSTRSCSPTAKRKPRKDAGSVRSRRLRARLRTPRGAALQPLGECEMGGRGSSLLHRPLGVLVGLLHGLGFL